LLLLLLLLLLLRLLLLLWVHEGERESGSRIDDIVAGPQRLQRDLLNGGRRQ